MTDQTPEPRHDHIGGTRGDLSHVGWLTGEPVQHPTDRDGDHERNVKDDADRRNQHQDGSKQERQFFHEILPSASRGYWGRAERHLPDSSAPSPTSMPGLSTANQTPPAYSCRGRACCVYTPIFLRAEETSAHVARLTTGASTVAFF